jgi:hypothetical protein
LTTSSTLSTAVVVRRAFELRACLCVRVNAYHSSFPFLPNFSLSPAANDLIRFVVVVVYVLQSVVPQFVVRMGSFRCR